MRHVLPLMLALTLLGIATPAPAAPVDLSNIVAAAKPAVVFIVALGPSGTQSGSGFAVASTATDTTIVTANHVVEGESQVDVVFDSNERERYTARIVRRDHVRDVAILSVPIGNRPTLALAPPASIREGMSIALIGYPMATIAFKKINGDALRPSIHGGIVSAIRLDGELVQFDAATYHGDSGGRSSTRAPGMWSRSFTVPNSTRATSHAASNKRCREARTARAPRRYRW